MPALREPILFRRGQQLVRRGSVGAGGGGARPEVLLQPEERVIQRALTRSPCPVIGLSDGHLPTAHIAALIQRQARLVVIKGDWLDAQAALLDEIASTPERLPEFTERPIPDLHSLQLLYRDRATLYRQAEVTIDASKLGPGIAAQYVVRGLGLEASG